MSVLEYRSGLDDKTDPGRGLARHWLGWAVYLGMSWTWCIGMFLPVLLIRDYGVWGWVAFAVPNVVGAAAMGWVLREGQSERIVAIHGRAIGAFSFVTAAFQVFFAFWVFDRVVITQALSLTIVLAILFWLAMSRGTHYRTILAGVVLGVSCVLIYRSGWRNWFGAIGRITSSEFPPELIGLTLVSAFGFLLCPYLDASFHRVRQTLTAAEGRCAYSAGFGVFFLAMIWFTLMYASSIASSLEALAPAIGIYWAVQLAFTIAVHWQTDLRRWPNALATLAVGVGSWYATRFMYTPTIDPGELIYRWFMSFYGLIFPAYVWICMIPSWREPVGPTRRQLAILAAAIVVAGPFYWVAFIDGKMMWVLPGVLLVLLARLAVPKTVGRS